MICPVDPIICTEYQAATVNTAIPEYAAASSLFAVLAPRVAVHEFDPYHHLSSDLPTL